MSDGVPDDPGALVEEEVREHVWDILTDPQSRPDAECVFCQQGVTLGVWAETGFPDPFAEDEDA